MVGRVIFVVAISAAVLIAVIWYLPVQSLLQARGYTPEQIAAAQQALHANTPTTTSPDDAARPPAGDGADTEDGVTPAMPGDDSETPEENEASEVDARETEAAAEPTTPAQPAPPQGLVATDVVNVRDDRGTEHEIIGQVEAGATVDVVTDPEGDWVEVEYDGNRGWVYRPLFRAQ